MAVIGLLYSPAPPLWRKKADLYIYRVVGPKQTATQRINEHHSIFEVEKLFSNDPLGAAREGKQT